MRYLIEDSFKCVLSDKHPLYKKDEKRNIVCIKVPREKVDAFPLKKGDNLVTDDGEGFNVLDFEWFTWNMGNPKHRTIGVMLDREMRRGEYVRIFSEVNIEELYMSEPIKCTE